MEIIENKEYGGERPLFAAHDLRLVKVTFNVGESALKRCRNIEADNCVFLGKYPFWHVKGFKVDHCVFEPGARAALWYSDNCEMRNTIVNAPKMFREMDGIVLDRVALSEAEETLWHCRNIDIKDVTTDKADYIFMHCENIRIDRYRQNGNYSFQYARNVEISNAVINSKDAFWQTENVTVRDSELHGEYLGWHSRHLHLINCHISGTQPLCYCKDLIVENCTFDADCDLAFEESELQATVKSPITSVKNPTTGYIKAPKIGEIIIDGNILAPADCKIETDD